MSNTLSLPPWMPEVQAPPAAPLLDAPPLSPLLVEDEGRPITSAAGWQARRAELRARWLGFLGHIPAAPLPVALEVLEEDRPAGCVRRLVRYESEPGLPVEGYLLFPEEMEAPAPGVVVLHQTVECTIREPAGLEGPESLHFALHLARRGCVTFAPRCYLWQYKRTEYVEAVQWLAGRHPGVRGMAKMLHDTRRAVDVLQSLPFVDPARIGCMGHSLGAKETLYLAAFDERVSVAVSSEGGIGLTFSNWDAPWYLGEEIRRAGFPLEHHQVLALVAPRAFLLLGGGDADGDRSWPFIESVLPVYDLLGVPRRAGLLNHGEGHSVPPAAGDRAYEWLGHFLSIVHH